MMTKTAWLVMVVGGVTLVGLMAREAAPQGRQGFRGAEGWGPGGAYGRMYDASTVEQVEGDVMAVESFVPRTGMSAGMHVQLKTGTETLSVHLGPAWFLERQDIEVAAGDRLTVKGSRISFEGKSALIAAEVSKGDHTLALRDAAGFPVWSGWRRR